MLNTCTCAAVGRQPLPGAGLGFNRCSNSVGSHGARSTGPFIEAHGMGAGLGGAAHS